MPGIQELVLGNCRLFVLICALVDQVKLALRRAEINRRVSNLYIYGATHPPQAPRQ